MEGKIPRLKCWQGCFTMRDVSENQVHHPGGSPAVFGFRYITQLPPPHLFMTFSGDFLLNLPPTSLLPSPLFTFIQRQQLSCIWGCPKDSIKLD